MEPHYRLPLLSWLPPSLADNYLRATGRGERYHERYRTRRGLRRMLCAFHVWDYTVAVISEPGRFHAGGELPAGLSRVPAPLLHSALPWVPTYIWVATPMPSRPRGTRLAVPPRRLG
jgi:hypothetical protein